YREGHGCVGRYEQQPGPLERTCRQSSRLTMVPKINLLYIRIAIVLTLLFLSGNRAFADDAQANTLLQQGRVDEARSALQSVLAAQPGDAYAHQLLCRVYYAQEMADAAIQECEL